MVRFWAQEADRAVESSSVKSNHSRLGTSFAYRLLCVLKAQTQTL